MTKVTGACVFVCVCKWKKRLKAEIITSGLSYSIFSHSASRCLWHLGTMKWTVFVMMLTISVASLLHYCTVHFVHLTTHIFQSTFTLTLTRQLHRFCELCTQPIPTLVYFTKYPHSHRWQKLTLTGQIVFHGLSFIE